MVDSTANPKAVLVNVNFTAVPVFYKVRGFSRADDVAITNELVFCFCKFEALSTSETADFL